jgi:hypothetical protein
MQFLRCERPDEGPRWESRDGGKLYERATIHLVDILG